MEERVELSERVIPEAPVLLDPRRHVPHGLRIEPTDLLAPVATFLDEAGALQVGEVLGDRLLRYLERLGQLAHGGWTFLEPDQNRTAGAVAQGGERGADGIHNPMVVDQGAAVKLATYTRQSNGSGPASPNRERVGATREGGAGLMPS